MLQKFGDLIIVDEPIDITDPRLQVARDDRSKVADFIVADLTKAAQLLKSCSDLADGRVSREGAEAMPSRVGLYEGTWEKFHSQSDDHARQLLRTGFEAAKAVIDSGEILALQARGLRRLGAEVYVYTQRTRSATRPG